MTGSSQAPGFFGKLRTHGDFVSRRLPPAVRDCFDHWLQGALLQSRKDLGEAWLPTWLGSPLWRFIVGPGVCGEQAWAGVMMPSHDRVGRCFPLLIASGIDGTPSLRDCITLHNGWFEGLEDLALSTLEEGFSLEVFDGALLHKTASLPGLLGMGMVQRSRGTERTCAAASVVALASEGLPARVDETLQGQSAWWTNGSPLVEPCLATCRGLPPFSTFSALLDGRWVQYGWEA